MTSLENTRSYERDIGRAAAILSVVCAIVGLSVNTGLFDSLPAEWIEHGISPASFVVVFLLSISTFIQAHGFISEEKANQRNIAALLLSLLATVLAGLLLAHNCSEKVVDCDHFSNQVARFAADKATDIPMALCLLFVCLTANLSQAWGKRATGLGQYLLLPVFVLVVLSLTSTVYGLRDLMMFGMSVAPSPVEAIVLIYVMVALVAARPGEGLAAVLTDKTAAGFVLRVLLPQGLLWPIALGYLRLLGQTQDWCNSELGAALMTVTTMVFLISASVWAAGKISALDLERRDSESEMSRLNENLREQIRQMTQLNKEQELVTLEAAKAHDLAIEASMQKAQFLSNMSHEIRTPMNGVLGMVEVLLRSELSEKAREYSLLIRESAQSLLTVINDILDFSKIEAGKVVIEVTDFEPLSVVEDVAEISSDEAKRRNITLMSYVEPDVPRQVQGDGARIRQVLSHLANHALNGSGTTSILIKCGVVEADDFVAVLRFSVEDDGAPVSDEDVEALFKQTPEGEVTPSSPFSAGVLGLSIARGLVDLMGGQIKSELVDGKKNSFGFQLPVKISHALPARTIAKELVGSRVLIVDDDFSSRQVLESYLASWRLRCELAPDPVSALGSLKSGRDQGDPFRLAIVDMRMPGMTGLELGAAIRADHTYNDLALILVTAYDDPSLGSEAIKTGFTAYFTKPVKQSQLFDCIINVIGQAVEDVDSEAPVELPSQTVELPKARFPTRDSMKKPDLEPADLQSKELPTARFPGGARSVEPVSEAVSESGFDPRTALPVLVVDDNHINRQVAEILLTEMGFKVELANDGKVAVAKVESGNYSLVFLDCQMPEMDGFEAARMIRKMETTSKKRLPIVAMTAESIDTARDECLAAGMDDFIMKPVEPQKLKKIAEQWIIKGKASLAAHIPAQPAQSPNVLDRDSSVAPAARASRSNLPAQPPKTSGPTLPPLPANRASQSNLPSQSSLAPVPTPPPLPAPGSSHTNLPGRPNVLPPPPAPPPSPRATAARLAAQKAPTLPPLPLKSADPEPAAPEEKLLNMTALKERFAEDEIKMLFGIVEESLGGELTKLRAALAADDVKAVASVAHAFKGASMSIEATALFELLLELEMAAKASESNKFSALAEKIETAYTLTIEVIRRYK